jgi:hypothetical protein
MTDDDDDAFSVFTEPDEVDIDFVPTNVLFVPTPIPRDTPELLNTLEQWYRARGNPPILFIEEVEDGGEIFENADEFAVHMGLPADAPLPTPAEAEAWIGTQRWASYSW